jgi:MFS family permease
MMALRFFMGVSEAGFGPGIPYLLSFFYLRHELGLRCGIFLAAAPLANTFAGALAYGITSGKHLSISNWRLLFLVEGLPTICLAPIVWFFLPDSPIKAKFLNEEEKRVAVARGVKQAGAADRVGKIVWRDIGAALIDPVAWFTAVSLFCRNILGLAIMLTDLK